MCTRTPLLCHSRGVKAANHVAPPSVLQHFPYDEWIGLSLIYQTQCVSVCVCATRSEWTITKNLLNSRCSLSAAICLSSIPSFHSQMQRYSSFRVSVSNLPNSPPPLPPPVTLSDWNTGASCHSCHRRAGLVSRSFHQTTGAYIQPQRLTRYTFTSCLISASPAGSATVRMHCVSNICHIGASLEKMDESEMSRKLCLSGRFVRKFKVSCMY